MKKNILAIGMAAIGVLGAVTLAGCNGGDEGAGAAYITTAIASTAGSGTRGAFDELVVNSEGEALEDHIGEGDWMLTAGTTGQVVAQVGGNSAFLGYISMGSVDANKDKIKAVKVNGVDATVAEVLAGNYELSRPFNLLYEDYASLSDAAKNFFAYIYSDAAAEIIGTEWIAFDKPAESPVGEYTAYTGAKATVTLHGSTSLQPMIKLLKEAYEDENPNVTIVYGGSGSGEAQAAVEDGSADFGMISRAPKGGELELGCAQVAIDGIAVVVNKNSALTNVTFDQLFDLFVEGTKIECK